MPLMRSTDLSNLGRFQKFHLWKTNPEIFTKLKHKEAKSTVTSLGSQTHQVQINSSVNIAALQDDGVQKQLAASSKVPEVTSAASAVPSTTPKSKETETASIPAVDGDTTKTAEIEKQEEDGATAVLEVESSVAVFEDDSSETKKGDSVHLSLTPEEQLLANVTDLSLLNYDPKENYFLPMEAANEILSRDALVYVSFFSLCHDL